MKKTLLAFALMLSTCVSASVMTNYVYVISNIYNNVYTESVITQKVKNTHYNYYYTNYVSVVTNTSVIVSRTNLSVNCDVSSAYVVAASNQANRAETASANAEEFSEDAAGSATTAASWATSASASAVSAATTRQNAQNECASALSTINARINWFDEHMDGRIDYYTYNYTTNLYYEVDSTARNIASNAYWLALTNAPKDVIEKSAACEVSTNAASYFHGSMGGVLTNLSGRTLCRTYPQTATIRLRRYYGGVFQSENVVRVTNRGSLESGKWFNYSYSNAASGYPRVTDAFFNVVTRVLVLTYQYSSSAGDKFDCHVYSDNSTGSSSTFNNKYKTLTRYHPFPYVGMNIVIHREVGDVGGEYNRVEAVVESITEDTTGALVDDYYVNSDFTISGVDDDYVFDRPVTKSEIVETLMNVMSRLGR